MATAKRKQEELGDECDDQEQQDNDCSDEDDAKRPRLDLHHQMHHLPHHRQWSVPTGVKDNDIDACAKVNSETDPNPSWYPNFPDEGPCDLSNWQVKANKFEQSMAENEREIANTSEVDNESVNETNDDAQPINFAYYHF